MSDRLPKSLRRRAASPLCARCRHLKSDHIVDRDGRNICSGGPCGCGQYVAGAA